MKNKFNTLQKYIFENSVKEYHKETVDGLFRAILEPVASNQKFESCILFRLLDVNGRESLLKRLFFTCSEVYSFSDALLPFEFVNSEKIDIWGTTQFVIVLGQRYSACLIWDFSSGSQIDYTNISILYNSKIITDIAKLVLDNSVSDFKDALQKYVPDRRENQILNKSINSIVDVLNDKNEEIFFSQLQNEFSVNSDDLLKTASIVADKAKFIAHEIKNNLSIINLYSKITQKRLEKIEIKDSEVQTSVDNAIKNINNASQTISDLINDLRCLSTPYKTDFNLKDFVLNTVALCEPKAVASGVCINVLDVDDIVLNSDRVKIQCALTNIIFNAIEDCKSGSNINVYSKIQDSYLSLFVLNNGEKISEDNQKRIFETNFTTKEKGNGLGLAICKMQLNLVGGDIKLVKSTDSETVFEISLKLD